MLVLWGARAQDVQVGSYEDWRRESFDRVLRGIARRRVAEAAAVQRAMKAALPTFKQAAEAMARLGRAAQQTHLALLDADADLDDRVPPSAGPGVAAVTRRQVTTTKLIEVEITHDAVDDIVRPRRSSLGDQLKRLRNRIEMDSAVRVTDVADRPPLRSDYAEEAADDEDDKR
jgi:hypothetical protein